MVDTGILGFDPLSTKSENGGLDEGIAQDAVRREVLNILKSYTGYFDIFSELIQNALDALDHRAAIGKFDPKIWIHIDIEKSRVRVVDNGIGMGVSEARFCFRPNVSFKQRKMSRGHKGVGATFIAYGFATVRLFTKKQGSIIAGQLRNGRQWAEDDTQSFERPSFENTTLQAEELSHEAAGTAIEVLIGERQRPQLNWLQATNASQWLDILRIKTPLGGIYLSSAGRKATPAVSVSVVDLSGNKTHVETSNTEYYYPHELPNLRKVATVRELETAISSIKGDPTTRLQRLPDQLKRLEAVYEVWDTDQILNDSTLMRNLSDEEQRVLLQRHQIVVYGCFLSTAKVWTSFQKEYLKVRGNAVLLRGGMQLASDCMPQGELTVIPLTSTIGYQANTHVIIHLTDGNPDMGRKVFQPEIKSLSDELARRTVDIFKRYISLMREDTGAPGAQASRVLWQFMKQQEEHLATQPLQLKKGFHKLPMASEPQSEQDVIALFHELLGMAVLRGYTILSTSESEKYDCIFFTDMVQGRDLYADSEPLGASERSVEEGQSPPWVLEYKYDSDSLVADFEKDIKFISDIRLLVCWQIGTKTKSEYALRSYLVGDEGSTRTLFGTTHAAFQERERRFDIICLKDLMSFLKDPAEEIARQRTAYLA